ncbi:MAG: exo-alpha-sialidase [Nitriliruptoraceae bacterium]|nr:exo-alpha-sialidase [Nitriliruptoraceae bacterium]
MAGVRILVGTAKGGFILRGDERREHFTVEGPLFGGWEVFHLAASPVDPERLYASQAGGWFGQIVQRSDDGGRSWNPVDNAFVYDGEVGDHLFYDGTPQPWTFQKVWHLAPSLTDADVVYAGVEDAALFRSDDAGASWGELTGLRQHPSGTQWQPGAGGLCLHTIVQDPTDPGRLTVAISAAGVFVTEDGGASFDPANRGLQSGEIPSEQAEVGHCVHKLAQHPSRPQTLFMQKHWDVMRSDDGGGQWTEISGDLPTDFGFAIDVHAHEPETVYVVPILSDSEHYPPDGALRVYRSRTGGGEWEPLTRGLPQEHCYVNVLRDAMAVDTMDECGVYVGTTGGTVFASRDGGDNWEAVVDHLPRILSVEVQTLP